MPSKRLPRGVEALALPRSAAPYLLSLAGLVGGLGAIWGMAAWGGGIDGDDTLDVTTAACLAVAVIIGAGNLFWLRSYRNPSTGLAPARVRPADPGRIAVRLLGLAMTIGLIGYVYWLFPEYGLSPGVVSWYGTYWHFLRYIAIVALPLTPFYFWWTDTRLVNPQDSYWHVGMLLLRRDFSAADWKVLGAHFAGWAVKAYFLALMITFLNNDVRILASNLRGITDFRQMLQYDFLYNLDYTVDLLFCVVGYTLTLRLFDSHIRSTEPTFFGWVIALIVYEPFASLVTFKLYLHYDDDIYWDNWLTGWPTIRLIWPVIIIVLASIYCLSTVAFGLRFSNLTYRGIITGGPYRFSKHPAYISKNLSWWLISVPWVSNHGWYEALRNCFLLGLLNLVYFLRARTEERHLSQDPAYVAYALWIEQNGLLRWVGQLIPFFKYKPPQPLLNPKIVETRQRGLPGPNRTARK